ncbi:MAG: cobalamin-dependent protein [Deltaproteobacteria bacterium]|nr:cobalamin-dependent protein [Deltaproteobacteria bacterium]
MMHIFLVDPPHKLFPGLRMWTPSFGLLSIAAYLQERGGFTVEILDCTTFSDPWGEMARRISTAKPQLIGVTCSATCLSPEALQAIRLAKRLSPQSVVVAGGGHFSLLAEEVMGEVRELDYIVMGEGEVTFFELASLLRDGGNGIEGIPGLAYRRDGTIAFTGPRGLIRDLDSLPMPAYHLLDMEADAYYWHGMGKRAFGISTSRGCGDRCAYCSESKFWEGVWRGRSGAMAVEEMRYLNQRYGKSLFVFNENSFNWSKARVEEFLQELGHSGMKVDFWFQSRVRDIVRDADLMPEFKRLGLYEVMLGVESVNPQVLGHYQKRQDREMAQEAIDILKRNGIMVMTNVMFGDWYDSEETLQEVFDFVKRQGDFLVLTITTPLPATCYHQEMEQKGLIKEREYGKYDFMHPIMPTKHLSREEVWRLQQKYLRKYYTQPRILLGAIFNRNPFKRMAYRLIMRYVWENATRREWRQPGYRPLRESNISWGG